MTACIKQLQTRLTRMAELRAAGLDWATVAHEVGLSEEGCRRWVRAHPCAWRRLYRAAEQDVLLEIRAEARLVLRNQMRSDDPAVVTAAAKILFAECRREWDEMRRPDSAPVGRRAEPAPKAKVETFAIGPTGAESCRDEKKVWPADHVVEFERSTTDAVHPLPGTPDAPQACRSVRRTRLHRLAHPRLDRPGARPTCRRPLGQRRPRGHIVAKRPTHPQIRTADAAPLPWSHVTRPEGRAYSAFAESPVNGAIRSVLNCGRMPSLGPGPVAPVHGGCRECGVGPCFRAGNV